MELLHNYSLVHDDIEDGDRLRHGRETVWAVYGLPHGVNAGDAIGALAQLALAQTAQVLDERVAFAMAMDLAAANLRMCEGQSLDISFEQFERAGVEAYVDMIGGTKSANTRHLAEIAEAEGVKAHLIENAGELRREWFAGDERVGIATGASTPGFLADDVVAKLQEWFPAAELVDA